jgi:hypothetical protein
MTRELSQALLSLARAAYLTDDGNDALRETFRDVACTITGRHDDHTWKWWQFFVQDVEALDEYRADPTVRDDNASESFLEKEVDISLWGLLRPGQSVCRDCVRLQGWRDGVLDLPASVFWRPLGECETHTPQQVVADPWRVAS